MCYCRVLRDGCVSYERGTPVTPTPVGRAKHRAVNVDGGYAARLLGGRIGPRESGQVQGENEAEKDLRPAPHIRTPGRARTRYFPPNTATRLKITSKVIVTLAIHEF